MKTIIEIGANKGQHSISFLKEKDTFLHCIEPVPQLFEELKKNFEEYSNVKFHQIAIDNFNGISKFGLSASYNGPGTESSYACSSLYDFSNNIKETWGNRSDFEMQSYIDVTVMTLASFVEKENISQIDYLHCDAQSSDLNILKSLGNKIDILIEGRCEASNTKKLYKNVDNSLHSILLFLEKNNFEVFELRDDTGKTIKELIFSLDDEGNKYLPHNTEEIDVFFRKKT